MKRWTREQVDIALMQIITRAIYTYSELKTVSYLRENSAWQKGARHSDEDIDERVIENTIVHNVKKFIMTFGKVLTFIGNQVHYGKLGHDHWIDLLFYNRDLRRTVVFIYL